MKKSLLIAVAVMFVVGISAPAYAHINQFITTINGGQPQSQSGAKFDAPHLIGLKQISPDLFVGIEGGKDILTDIFDGDLRHYFDSDKGYFGYVKITYEGCWLNCPNK